MCQNQNRDRPKLLFVTLKIKEPYQHSNTEFDMALLIAFKSEQVSIYKFMFIKMGF